MTTAAFYTPGRIKPIRLICLHTMEDQSIPDQAVEVARWFSDPKRSPKASAHVCVDGSNAGWKSKQPYKGYPPIVRVVDDRDTAWAAPGANADGLHIEMAGRAAETKNNWADPYSLAVIDNAATVAAIWVQKYKIPVRHLTIDQLRDPEEKGIIGHVDATNAFPDLGGTHQDPGVNFPWEYFLQILNKKLA